MILLRAAALSLLLAAVQDGPVIVTIGKSSAARYRAALKKYKEAQDALDQGDLSTAFDKSTEIVEDPKIEKEKRECLLRIQNSDSTLDPPAAFFPVFVHAKAAFERAKKQIADGKKEDGLAKLQAAKTDVEESVSRNVPGSPELLKEINDGIAANSTNEEDPLVKARRAYEAKLRDALTAEVAGDLAAAKKLYEEALALDATSAKAKESIARMEGRLREEQAFAALTRMADTDEKKIPACDEFLKTFPSGVRAPEVQGLRARLTRAIADSASRREAEFRDQWLSLRSAGKFKDALELVRSKGPSILKPEALKDLSTQTTSACDAFIAGAVRDFRLNLSNLDSTEILAGLSPEALERDYALPDPAQLITKNAALDWCRALRPALEQLRALGAEPPALKAIAILSPSFRSAPPLVDQGENGFFRAMAALVHSAADRALGALVQRSRQADEKALAEILAEAAGILKAADELDAGLSEALKAQPDKGKAWRERHSFWDRDLKAMKRRPEEFPREAKDLDRFAKELTDATSPEGVYGANAETVLTRIESDLKRLRTNDWAKLSLDGRRKLLTYAACAAAMRLLLEGQTAEQAAKQLEEYATDLAGVNGPLIEEARKLGPKVEKVLALLKR